jgi:Fe-S cluster assembly protein SufD
MVVPMTDPRPYTEAFRPNTRDPEWLAELRRGALQRFETIGLPTRRQENWRFTNLRPLEETPFPPASAVPAPDADALAPYQLDPDNPRLVMLNGRPGAFSPGEALAPKQRFLLMPTAAAAPRLEGKIGLGEAVGNQPFVALNAALFADGFTVIMPPHANFDRPVEIVHWSESDAPAAVHTRNLIEIGAGGSVTIVESFAGRGRTWTNDVTQIRLAEGARLRHVRLQDEAATALHIANLNVELAGGASYEGFTLTLGAELSRTDIAVALGGAGAHCAVNGAYLLRHRQEATIATLIDHAAPSGTTREIFKGVVEDRAHGVFQGKIQVRQAAQKTDAHQLNKNLLLSPRAAVDTKPELEIFADDVKCSHGATVGDLDENALFYLVSRGLRETEARRLLIDAFAADAIDLVGNADAKAYLRRHLDRWLAHRED